MTSESLPLLVYVFLVKVWPQCPGQGPGSQMFLASFLLHHVVCSLHHLWQGTYWQVGTSPGPQVFHLYKIVSLFLPWREEGEEFLLAPGLPGNSPSDNSPLFWSDKLTEWLLKIRYFFLQVDIITVNLDFLSKFFQRLSKFSLNLLRSFLFTVPFI